MMREWPIAIFIKGFPGIHLTLELGEKTLVRPVVSVPRENLSSLLQAHSLQEALMSDLIAVAYQDQHKAAEVLNTVQRLQKEYLIDLEDAAYITKDKDGKVRLHQSVKLPLIGALTGTVWGTLIGLLFLNPLLGAALGAASGALSGALTDYGIDDKFMKELAQELKPGSSALFILVRRMTPDKVISELSRYGGKILQSSLTKEAERQLQQALEAERGAHPEGASTAGSKATIPGTSPRPAS
jgi:uncharacterized membrane protein